MKKWPLAIGLGAAAIGFAAVAYASRSAYLSQARTLKFSDRRWLVKSSLGLVGPGPNRFSDAPENVWVDERGRLHLRITRWKSRWYSSEVVSRESFGYGTYRFTVETAVDGLDPNVVLGLFTWSDDPTDAHREIDIELSRWGDRRNPANAQFVVQPSHFSGHRRRFRVPSEADHLSFEFTWEPERIVFRAVLGEVHGKPDAESVLAEWACEQDIPEPGDENVRMNLWLRDGLPPMSGEEAEVVLSRFEFLPFEEDKPTASE